MEKFYQCGKWQDCNHVYVNIEKRRENREREKNRGVDEREE